MDNRDFLLNIFDTKAGIYALHIIPSLAYGYGVGNPKLPKTYSGIHFVDTASLLSIRQDVPEFISVSLNKHGEIIKVIIGSKFRSE